MILILIFDCYAVKVLLVQPSAAVLGRLAIAQQTPSQCKREI